jgi:hypothetical protein
MGKHLIAPLIQRRLIGTFDFVSGGSDRLPKKSRRCQCPPVIAVSGLSTLQSHTIFSDNPIRLVYVFVIFKSLIDRDSRHLDVPQRFAGFRLGFSRKIERCFATIAKRIT